MDEFTCECAECAVLQNTLYLPRAMGEGAEQHTGNDRTAAMKVRQKAKGGTKATNAVVSKPGRRHRKQQ